MAGSGLLAGLQGYESVAEAPGRRVAEGIVGAVDQGIGAYTATSRVRQGEEEGARSQQRLDMAQALQPGQMRGQQLANDTHALALQEAGDTLTRQKAQRDYFQSVVAPKIEGRQYTDAKEARLDVLKGIMIGGDATQIKAAFGDYQRSLTDDETAKHFDGMLFHVWDTQARAAQETTTAARAATLLQGIGEGRRLYPLATGSPEIRQLITESFKLAKQMPEPLKNAFTNYVQTSAANPGLSPAEVWSRAGERLDPGFLSEWNAMTPQDVRDDRAAKLAGVKEETKAEAQEKRDLAKIKETGAQNVQQERARGEEQRKTEALKETGRQARGAAPEDKALKAQEISLRGELNNITNNLAKVDGLGKPVLKGDERMQAVSRQTQITKDLDEIRGMMRTPGGPAQAGPPASTRPKGVSADRLGGLRAAMAKDATAKAPKFTSMAGVDRYLTDPAVQALASDEDIAVIRAEYEKKLGGK